MGVVIEICVKYPGGPTRIKGTECQACLLRGYRQKAAACLAIYLQYLHCLLPYLRA
jgi:hypothetical protein